MEKEKLVRAAYQAKEFSYAPYSNFHVGAALLGESGRVYLGCNIENAAFSPTNCAERTAVFKAVSEGERKFKAIALAGDKEEYLTPCGVCRQVMAEFCDPGDFQVICAKNETDFRVYTLQELFPDGFSPENL